MCGCLIWVALVAIVFPPALLIIIPGVLIYLMFDLMF